MTCFAANPPRVLCDRIQVQQVLINLILNACDAMSRITPGARRLEVTTLHAGEQIEIVVRDTGSGITLDDIDRVFDPFVTSKPNGLGLGLAIWSIDRAVPRRRILASNNSSGGSTFAVSLPRASPDENRDDE